MKKQSNPLQTLIDLTNGDENFIREMLGIFIKNTPESIVRIKASIDQKDFSSLSDHAHKLKSSIQILGDDDLFELIKKIENTAKSEGNKDDLIIWIDELIQELTDLLSWMIKRLEDPEKFV